ncbi:MAG: TrmH family RNA methyltransferase [Candidatus Nanopelagicaceae bacterium]
MKALLSSKKERTESKLFVAEGIQGVREALLIEGEVETLYLSKAGAERLSKAGIDYSFANVVDVADKVAEAMSDAITSQGIIAICRIPVQSNENISTLAVSHVIYLHEIQDPGNAGTILRTADAMGISAVVASPGSVDFYSPKVVRSTAGSLWHIPLYSGVELSELRKILPTHNLYLLDGNGDKSLFEVDFKEPAIWIFGNEARGLQEGFTEKVAGATRISIAMPGKAESLNLAAAAAIVMHEISRGR